MRRNVWKEWVIRINFVYEGYSGYDHRSSSDIVVKARNQREAFKLAKKRFTHPSLCEILSVKVESVSE